MLPREEEWDVMGQRQKYRERVKNRGMEVR